MVNVLLLPVQLPSARADPLVYFPVGKEQFHTFNPYLGAAHILYVISAELNLDKVGDSLFGHHQPYYFDFPFRNSERGKAERRRLF